MPPTPGATVEPVQTEESLFTWRLDPTATPKSPEAQVAENITAALPDLDDLGSAELKGPELNIAGNQFNLFKTKIGMSLPVFNNTQINIDHKNHTAEVLLGLEGGADAVRSGVMPLVPWTEQNSLSYTKMPSRRCYSFPTEGF